MPLGKKLPIVFLALVAAGYALRPFEDALRRDFESAQLLYQPLDLNTREEIGQVSFAVTLGGLRSLVASMMNITGVQKAWREQDWFEIEDQFQTIVTLQPRTRYYWQEAKQHLALNAWADYSDRPGLTAEQRKARQEEALRKGREFLERGMKALPDDWHLVYDLAYLWENPHRPPNDLPAAAEAYRSALTLPGAPKYLERRLFYVLSRLPDGREEAYQLSRELLADEDHRTIPSVQSQAFALQQEFAPEEGQMPLEKLFGSRGRALEQLSYYWRRRSEGYPMTGVAETIGKLLAEFDVPAEFSPLRERAPDEPRWFGFPEEIIDRLHSENP